MIFLYKLSAAGSDWQMLAQYDSDYFLVEEFFWVLFFITWNNLLFQVCIPRAYHNHDGSFCDPPCLYAPRYFVCISHTS